MGSRFLLQKLLLHYSPTIENFPVQVYEFQDPSIRWLGRIAKGLVAHVQCQSV